MRSTARRRSKRVVAVYAAIHERARATSGTSTGLIPPDPVLISASRVKLIAFIYALCIVYRTRNSTHLPPHSSGF